ncbi:hypothetical protein NY2A_b325R [Paramecium bursaria Chlorella virus NY2A]|uniref:Uncharacterized protein b325R n=1 Tax=Paramecium bursaria Chlorella virus NY2A TaxID=46021 RepID=A7IWK0_PBCVN|nr:hypothetical protein NY2A_b325R [Paramecium bursaria Chlorella virus NY2A]ABT14724.1 hypothetical protein NY2A_b325R [Paramecium bursaria Chlorella virus NY2A]
MSVHIFVQLVECCLGILIFHMINSVNTSLVAAFIFSFDRRCNGRCIFFHISFLHVFTLRQQLKIVETSVLPIVVYVIDYETMFLPIDHDRLRQCSEELLDDHPMKLFRICIDIDIRI